MNFKNVTFFFFAIAFANEKNEFGKSITACIANLENFEEGISVEGVFLKKYPHLKKAGKIGSSAFSVIKALNKLN